MENMVGGTETLLSGRAPEVLEALEMLNATRVSHILSNLISRDDFLLPFVDFELEKLFAKGLSGSVLP
jgi:hypothetical protein